MKIMMPRLKEAEDEATVEEILVEPGDWVDDAMPVLVASINGRVYEVDSEHEGTVSRVLVEEGQTVMVGEALIELR